jgi:hypothetical protein
MGEVEASAVPAIVLLSILRREIEDILRYLSERGEFTEVFNHLLGFSGTLGAEQISFGREFTQIGFLHSHLEDLAPEVGEEDIERSVIG